MIAGNGQHGRRRRRLILRVRVPNQGQMDLENRSMAGV
jgi:hypothetical protein